MKLLDYIRGIRKGKEAHRLEKESMKDPFLADAMDGYRQVEGNHEQRIRELRMKLSAHSAKNKNKRAVTWSIAACLLLAVGISSYLLLLEPAIVDKPFVAKEKMSPPAAPVSPSPALSVNSDSVHTETVPSQPANNIIAKAKQIPQQEDLKVMAEEAEVSKVAETRPIEAKAIIKADRTAEENMIKGKVTDAQGEPIIGASVSYEGTTIGTLTDVNGEFSLPKEEGKKLLACSIGFEPAEMAVDSNRNMLIAMNDDRQALDEVVVTGYGRQKKDAVSGSASARVESEAIQKDQIPQPTIGMRKYKSYLRKNLVRPEDEACKDAKGKVVLSFSVDKEGKPQNITVVDGLCETADKEAIRLVKEGPKWTYSNLPVTVTVEF